MNTLTSLSPGRFIAIPIFICVAFLPLYAEKAGDTYSLLLGTRAIAIALAALSVAFILNVGGMASFGHAAYVGIGAYAAAIPTKYGIESGFVHLVAALGASGLFALAAGAASVRISGVFFIMITLAFAQMVYFLFVGLKTFGGDEGLVLAAKSHFGPLDMADPAVLYWVSLGVLALAFLSLRYLAEAPFGRTLLGGKINERRMRALGVELYGYRLTAFVLSGMLAGVAGLILANATGIASPSFLAWQRSGDYLIIVTLGGMGSLAGSMVGAVVFLAFEHLLPVLSNHWPILLGALLVIVARARVAETNWRSWFSVMGYRGVPHA